MSPGCPAAVKVPPGGTNSHCTRAGKEVNPSPQERGSFGTLSHCTDEKWVGVIRDPARAAEERHAGD